MILLLELKKINQKQFYAFAKDSYFVYIQFNYCMLVQLVDVDLSQKVLFFY